MLHIDFVFHFAVLSESLSVEVSQVNSQRFQAWKFLSQANRAVGALALKHSVFRSRIALPRMDHNSPPAQLWASGAPESVSASSINHPCKLAPFSAPIAVRAAA